MNIFDDFFTIHTFVVETFLGAGASGNVYAAAVTVPCFSDDARRLVRNKDGEQVISESILYTYLENAPLFTPGTRVTVLSDADTDELDPSRAALVTRVTAYDAGTLSLPEHVAVTLA
jgi:hypothetical protein